MPISKVFINSFVATMTLFQLSYSEIGVPINWVQFESLLNTKINVIQTILLQNGLFYFGCFVGTQITLLLQKQSNKFIFLLSDLLNLFANYNYFPLPYDLCFVDSQDGYNYYCQSPPDIKQLEMSLNFYFIIRFLIAIALGINLTQAILYIKQLTYKAKKGYLFLLVPLQIQLGYFIGGFVQPYSIQFTYCTVTIIRMILLLILEFETPNYYYFVKQNIRATKQTLSKIHDDEEIKKQIINKFRRQESQVLISRQLIKKSLLCVSLVIITQLSGFSILSAYYSRDEGWVRNLMGLLVITTFIAFGKKINKSNQILVGQLIVCLGLGVFSFINSSDYSFTYFAICLVTFGHYTGLGSLIYQIIPILLPQLGIIDCMIALWTTNLAQMCIFGIFFYKQQHQEQYRQQFNDIIQMYFYFSCFGLLYLFFILRNHNKVEKEEEVNEEAVDTKIELVQNQVY